MTDYTITQEQLVELQRLVRLLDIHGVEAGRKVHGYTAQTLKGLFDLITQVQFSQPKPVSAYGLTKQQYKKISKIIQENIESNESVGCPHWLDQAQDVLAKAEAIRA